MSGPGRFGSFYGLICVFTGQTNMRFWLGMKKWKAYMEKPIQKINEFPNKP